ncbi:MAG: hypothetical protein AAGG54_04860 [Pseudomonadota bacterium]
MTRGWVPLRHLAYSAFLRLLEDGRVCPGEALSQSELTRLTGFPLAAVRDMICRLESEGLMRALPRRGVQVAYLHMDFVRDVFDLRAVIEREGFSALCSRADATWLAENVAAHRALRDAVQARPRPPVASGARASASDWASDAAEEECATRAEPHKPDASDKSDATNTGATRGATPSQPNQADIVDRLHALDADLRDAAIAAIDNDQLTEAFRINQVKARMIARDRVPATQADMIAEVDERLAILYALQSRNLGRVLGAVRAHHEASKRRALMPFMQASPRGTAVSPHQAAPVAAPTLLQSA